MPVTRSASTRPTPYSKPVPQLPKVSNRLKKAKTVEENELSKKKTSKRAPLPEFAAAHQVKLTKIYNSLSTKDKRKQDTAFEQLKKDSAALSEFLLKTLPPAGCFPDLETLDYTYLKSLLVPQTCVIYKDVLTRIHEAIRVANTQDEREEVLREVVENSHLVQEFLKRNVPQFSHL